MEIEWRNGALVVGRLFMERGYGVKLEWGNREDMGQQLQPGERIFADMVRIWWPQPGGRWLPRVDVFGC